MINAACLVNIYLLAVLKADGKCPSEDSVSTLIPPIIFLDDSTIIESAAADQ